MSINNHGSLNVPSEIYHKIFDFTNSAGMQSLLLSSSHMNEAYRMRISNAFKTVFDSIPNMTEELQAKLEQYPVFLESKVNTLNVFQNPNVIRALQNTKNKFIRGIDQNDHPFIVFALTSKKITLFDRPEYISSATEHWSCNRRNVVITFDTSGVYSSNYLFSIEDLIQLLEHGRVVTSFELYPHNVEWNHISDTLLLQHVTDHYHTGFQYYSFFISRVIIIFQGILFLALITGGCPKPARAANVSNVVGALLFGSINLLPALILSHKYGLEQHFAWFSMAALFYIAGLVVGQVSFSYSSNKFGALASIAPALICATIWAYVTDGLRAKTNLVNEYVV